MSMFPVSVVIPVFNEEEAIADCIGRNIAVLSTFADDYELIVVNDGSIDATLAVINKTCIHLPFVTIISYAENGGLGKAIRTGIAAAKKEYILCVPVDSPLNKEMFISFQQNAHKADVIASYRPERIGYSQRMKLNSFCYQWLISFMFRLQLKDYNWIHLYHRKIFDEQKFSLQANGLFVLVEVLVLSNLNNYRIAEIPVPQEMRLTGIATASKYSAILKTVKELIVFSLNRHLLF